MIVIMMMMDLLLSLLLLLLTDRPHGIDYVPRVGEPSPDLVNYRVGDQKLSSHLSLFHDYQS